MRLLCTTEILLGQCETLALFLHIARLGVPRCCSYRCGGRINSFKNLGEFIVRKAGDRRPDTQAKRELMEKIVAEGNTIRGVFEDRLSVCGVWREMGLTVFQMNDKEF